MVERARVLSGVLLLLMAAIPGVRSEGGDRTSEGALLVDPKAPSPAARGPVDVHGLSVLERFLARPDEPVRSYRARRRLWSEGAGRAAFMEVGVALDPEAGFRWEVLAEEGSGIMRNKGFRGMLEREAKAYSWGSVSESSFTDENYELSVKGLDSDGHVRLRARPRRREATLVDGTFVVRPEDSDLVRVEGLLAKGPSFWTPRVEVVRHYRRIHGHRVMVRLESTAHIRLVGAVRMVAEYDYETIDGEPIAPREGEQTMHARSKTTSEAEAAERKSRVTLVAPIANATEVAATGDFTDWSPDGVPLKRRRDGAWSRTLYLPPGRYEYRLRIDGRWGNNPAAEHRENPYGSENDVLLVR